MINTKKFHNDPDFIEFYREELTNNLKNKTRLSGRVASDAEVTRQTIIGKAAEWWLIKNTDLVKVTEDHFKLLGFNPKYVKYNDLFDAKTNSIIEVKVWNEPWCNLTESNGLTALRRAKGIWMFATHVIIFKNEGDDCISLVQRITI